MAPRLAWLPLLLGIVLRAGAAAAQTRALEVGDTTSALPGVVRVPMAGSAERLGPAAAVAGGYGFTESVLAQKDTHHRLLGSLSASLRSSEWLAFALRLDGRYDWHRGVPDGNGGGWIGEPRLIGRVGSSSGAGLGLGAQAVIALPGAKAPSADFNATSPELSVLASYAPPSWPVALTSELGFRLDRSAQTVPDPDRLRRADRLALGISDTNALLLGAGVVGRAANGLEALAEWTWDLRVPPEGLRATDSPMRLDAGVRWTPTDRGTVQLQLLVEVSPSSRPSIGPGEPLAVVEPRVSGIMGLILRPSRPSAAPPPSEAASAPPPKPTEQAAAPAAPSEAKAGSARGRITDQDGRAVARARVHIGGLEAGVDVETDAQGGFERGEIAPGKTEVSVAAEGYRGETRSVEIVAGQTAELDVQLTRALPEGQIRGLVRSFAGASIAATARIEPLGKEVAVGESGRFEFDVPPGDYDVIVRAPGYVDQHRHVRVEANGVVVIDLDMRTRR